MLSATICGALIWLINFIVRKNHKQLKGISVAARTSLMFHVNIYCAPLLPKKSWSCLLFGSLALCIANFRITRLSQCLPFVHINTRWNAPKYSHIYFWNFFSSFFFHFFQALNTRRVYYVWSVVNERHSRTFGKGRGSCWIGNIRRLLRCGHLS